MPHPASPTRVRSRARPAIPETCHPARAPAVRSQGDPSSIDQTTPAVASVEVARPRVQDERWTSMALWSPNSPHAPRTLSELDVSAELVHKVLFAALADAQLCSAFDSPTAFGSTLWTRSNRYLREELVPLKWTITNSKLILRTIHPSGSFAITAASASGAVGDLTGNVRAKNPKGVATAQMIAANQAMPFVFGNAAIDSFRDDTGSAIPTWFLLYKRTDGAILSELSYPVEMTDLYVDKWMVRLPVEPLETGSGPRNWGDPEAGPDFTVEEL